MSYQNVGTPRFYVDILSYLNTQGLVSSVLSSFPSASIPIMELIGINPSNIGNFYNGDGDNDVIRYDCGVILKTIMPVNKNFSMVLGHNFGTAEASFYAQEGEETGGSYSSVASEGLVNADGASDKILYDGFSIRIGNDAIDMETRLLQFRFDYQGLGYIYNATIPLLKIGSLLYGTYYDMLNAPNLSLSLSYEYGGIKETTTRSGQTLTNAFYTKPPKWGNLGAWELDSGNPALSRSGRRGWDLKFSYMDNGDLWGPNQMLSQDIGSEVDTEPYGGPGGDIGNSTYFNVNLLTDDNFFSQVWHKTLGGTLPFIFQPDSDGDTPGSGNNNPDQFAICKFKDNSLKVTQSAFNVYDISLSIEEAW